MRWRAALVHDSECVTQGGRRVRGHWHDLCREQVCERASDAAVKRGVATEP